MVVDKSSDQLEGSFDYLALFAPRVDSQHNKVSLEKVDI